MRRAEICDGLFFALSGFVAIVLGMGASLLQEMSFWDGLKEHPHEHQAFGDRQTPQHNRHLKQPCHGKHVNTPKHHLKSCFLEGTLLKGLVSHRKPQDKNRLSDLVGHATGGHG